MSSKSVDVAERCRICWDDAGDKLLKVCRCDDPVHLVCLNDWLRFNPTLKKCQACQQYYEIPLKSRLLPTVYLVCRSVLFVVAVSAVMLTTIYTIGRPVGVSIWMLFGLFSTKTSMVEPAPLLLSVLKHVESYDGFEDRLHMTFYMPQSAPYSLFLRHLDPSSCYLINQARIRMNQTWLKDAVRTLLNSTLCASHPMLGGAVPQSRVCECDSDQSLTANLIASKLWPFVLRSGSQLPAVCGVWWRPLKLQWPYPGPSLTRKIFDIFLPALYKRNQEILNTMNDQHLHIDYRLEITNPRFYGSIGFLNPAWESVYFLKSNGLHFCMAIPLGVVIDVLLVLHLWFADGLVVWMPNGAAEPVEDQVVPVALNGQHNSWLASVQELLHEHWNLLLTLGTLTMESFINWWESSTCASIVKDVLWELLVFLWFSFQLVLIYCYSMALISIVILKMFQDEILLY